MQPANLNPGTHGLDLGGGNRLWQDDTGHFWLTQRTVGGLDIHTPISTDLVPIYSDVIDLTATGTYTIVLPTPKKVYGVTLNFALATVGGTRSAGPTWQAGGNSTIDDLAASAAGAAGLRSQAANTLVTSAITLASPLPTNVDLTSFGLRVSVTVGMSGAGAVATGRFVGQLQLGA